MPLVLGALVGVCPVPAGDELAGNGHVFHLVAPDQWDWDFEFGFYFGEEDGKVCAFGGLEGECVVVLEEELDWEVLGIGGFELGAAVAAEECEV